MQWSFFALFLFAVGYESGPQFYGGLGRSAVPQIGLSVFFCAVGVASAYFFLAKLFEVNAGSAAGVIAGEPEEALRERDGETQVRITIR